MSNFRQKLTKSCKNCQLYIAYLMDSEAGIFLSVKLSFHEATCVSLYVGSVYCDPFTVYLCCCYFLILSSFRHSFLSFLGFISCCVLILLTRKSDYVFNIQHAAKIKQIINNYHLWFLSLFQKL